MGTASRKTWLEKQSDEVQMFVLSMDEAALTLDQMLECLQEKHQIKVPRATLGNSLKVYHDTMELRAAEEWADQFEKICEENPHIQAAKLARGFLTQKMASAKFRDSELKSGDLVFFAQKERALDLLERKTAAQEDRNRLQKEKQELDRQRQEFQEKKWRKAVKEATDETEGKIKQGKSITIDDINRIRERVFGLPAVQGQVSE